MKKFDVRVRPGIKTNYNELIKSACEAHPDAVVVRKVGGQIVAITNDYTTPAADRSPKYSPVITSRGFGALLYQGPRTTVESLTPKDLELIADAVEERAGSPVSITDRQFIGQPIPLPDTRHAAVVGYQDELFYQPDGYGGLMDSWVASAFEWCPMVVQKEKIQLEQTLSDEESDGYFERRWLVEKANSAKRTK